MSNAFSRADQLRSPHSHTRKHATLSCFILVVTCIARVSPWPCFVAGCTDSPKRQDVSYLSYATINNVCFSAFALQFQLSHESNFLCKVQSSHVHWCFIAVVSGYMWTHVNPCVLFCSQEANTNTENTEMPLYNPAPKAHTPRVKKMKVRLIVCVCVPVYATSKVSVGMFP